MLQWYIFHSIECRFPLPCFRGRLWFPPALVGLLLFVDVAAGHGLAAILFSSSQSQGDAIEEPCRPSKAAPTHLLANVNWTLPVKSFHCIHLRSHEESRASMVGRPNEKVSVPKCMMESQSYGTPKIVYPGNISSLICSPCCWMNWSRIKRIAGLAKKNILTAAHHNPCTCNKCHRSVRICLWCSL